MIRGQVGVNHRRLDIGVAHELLHGRQVDALHDKLTGESVTEGVQGGKVRDVRVPGNSNKHTTELSLEPAAIAMGKYEITSQT